MNEYPQLYHLTVRRPDAIAGAVFCSFSEGTESLVLARGQWLEVLELNSNEELTLKVRTNLFATIRCIDRVRIPGVNSDLLVLTSDSGEVTLLRFSHKTGRFTQFASEEVASPKSRRELPGEYLAVDPNGRVAMVASIDNLRSVVVFHDEGINAAPVETSLPSMFCYSVVAIDRGYENPAFACLERFRFSKKVLSLYEFSLGLNHLIKLWSREVSDESDLVLSCPGGRDLPTGLLLFMGSELSYVNASDGGQQASIDLQRRIVSASLIELEKNDRFVLAFAESGTILSIRWTYDDEQHPSLSYAVMETDSEFQSIPEIVISSTSGLIFCSFSSGNHQLYQISHIGEEEGDEVSRPKLERISELQCLSPITTSLLQKRQILLGKGTPINSAALALLKPGITTDELASTPLPKEPATVFSTRREFSSEYDDLIVIGFKDNTTVALAVDENGAVEEVSEADTGIAAEVKTLGIARLHHGIVQIHKEGLRYITTNPINVTPWLVPPNKHVCSFSYTHSQVLLALSDNKLVYFEEKDGSLSISQQRLELSKSVTAMCFAATQPGELKSMRFFIALDDETIRQHSIPDLKQTELYGLDHLASSVVHYLDTRGTTGCLCVGHFNGALSNIRDGEKSVRVIGSSPVYLSVLSPCTIVAISSRIWVLKNGGAVPLLGTPTQGLRGCHGFTTQDLPSGGVIGIKSSTLEVFSINEDTEKTGYTIEASEPLASTPASTSILKKPGTGSYIAMLKNGQCCAINPSSEMEISTSELTATGGATTKRSNPRAFANFRYESHEYLVTASNTILTVYRIADEERFALELVHDTEIGIECNALVPFKDMLLAGVGNSLILYKLGQKQLLRQGGLTLAELVKIRAIKISQNLIFVGDSRHSVTVVRYSNDGDFKIMATDPVARSVTCMELLDTNTVCIGDQYGNIAVLRYSSQELISLANPDSPSPLKLIAHFWLPEAVIGLHRGNLSPVAGPEAIVYIGLQGTIGVLIPFISRSEYEFFYNLETNLRAQIPQSLLGRSIDEFRNMYTPLRNIIDGDFCEYATSALNQNLDGRFNMDEISEVLSANLASVFFRLENIRYRSITHTV